MDSPLIQLLLKGRLVQTYSFQGDALRVGRMRENDIVISNASVSRFHAVLRREKGKVILEDSGSENGCYVNGTRIVNSIVLAAGDEILIGKHHLVLSEAEAEEEAPSELVKEEKSDVWDASQTYFVAVEDQAKMLGGAGAEPATGAAPDAEEEPSLPAASDADEAESPAPEIEPVVDDALIESATADFEGAEPEPIADVQTEPVEDAAEEVEAWSTATSDADEEGESDETTSPPELEEKGDDAPFDFDLGADLVSASSEGEATVDPGDFDVEVLDEEVEEENEETVDFAGPPTEETEPPEEPIWHAGLIIQHHGKLDRIISWDQDQLVAGRSRECEIFLNQDEISRRHALFVREEGLYEVRDLDSINGILVNGEKTRERGLEVGDVVKIEDFEITFLLDRQPIASEIKTDELATPASSGAEDGFNMTMIDEDLPISAAIGGPGPAAEPAVRVEEKLAEIPEGSLFDADEAEEEDVVEIEAISPVPPEAEDSQEPVAADDLLTFEVRVRVEDLPATLRAAVADLAPGELRLPVEIVLKSDD
jgi:pSer/pThr/pTyr-binding forkhead associated (FHA) protein